MSNLNERRNITPDSIEEQNDEAPVKKSKFNQKNYLNVSLGDQESTKTLTIRLLTIDKDTNSPFAHLFIHNVKVQKELAANGYKNYICLAKTDGLDERLGKKCPFCELNKKAYDESVKAHEAGDVVNEKRWKDISIANIAKPSTIIRCVERGFETDGPKFWKFNKRIDKLDAEAQIMELYRTRKEESIADAKEDNDGVLPEDFEPMNILDIDYGRDLKVTITRETDKKNSIKILDTGRNKPLAKDTEVRDALVNDEKVWQDVFVAKPYDFLAIVADGEVPFFDKQNKKWVPKSEIMYGMTEEETKKEEEKKEANRKIDEATERIKNDAHMAYDSSNVDDIPF